MAAVVETCAGQVYNLSQSKSIPEFLADAVEKHVSVKRDKDFKNRLEIIHGFEFSASSAKVKVSADGRYVGCVGMYPPDIKVYDTTDLSLKFERRVDHEVVDFLFLTQDYKKMVFLEGDRSVEFHGPGGRHHRERIPSFGRTLNWDDWSAELSITSATSQIYRLDLFQGAFLESYNCATMQESLASARMPAESASCSRTLLVGGVSRSCELFDTRTGTSPVNSMTILDDDDIINPELGIAVTALACSPSAYNHQVAFGTSQSIVKIFDIRQPAMPVCVRDHNVDSPITDVQYAWRLTEVDEDPNVIVSSDERSVKVWTHSHSLTGGNARVVKNIAAFQSQGKIHGICVYPRTGMIFVAQDHPRVGVHFIPDLGVAPTWSPFVDQLVEDMHESSNMGIFDNYEFVTRADLHRVGLDPTAIGPMIQPHQHGYLIDSKYYKNWLVSKNQMAEKDITAMLVQQHLDQKDEQNILRLKISQEEEEAPVDDRMVRELQDLAKVKKPSAKRKSKAAKAVLSDDRFTQLLQD